MCCLDNDISWEETVDMYYGSYRPVHYKFCLMGTYEDKDRMENLEDLLQEAMYMKMLRQIPVEQVSYLLGSIPDGRLFINRKKDYDPELIER